MCLPSNSSCNTTPHKFGVVNLVAQHYEAAHQKFSGDGYFRLGLITTTQQASVKLLELRVFSRSRLTSFVEQKSQQARTLFANAAHPPTLRRLIFDAIQAGIPHDTPRRRKPRDRVERVTQRQGRQQPDSWMRAQQLHCLIIPGALRQAFFHRADLFIHQPNQRQPFIALLAQYGRQRQGLQLLHPRLRQQPSAQGQASVDANGMHRILGNGTDLHQLVPITQLSQHRATLSTEGMHAGKVTLHYQVQHQVSIAPIVLLFARRLASNLRGITQPHRVAQLCQHLLKPSTVTTGFEGHYYFAPKLFIKLTHVIMLMAQFSAMDFPLRRIAPTNRLFTRMKINCDVYWHLAPPFVSPKTTGLESTRLAAGGALS